MPIIYKCDTCPNEMNQHTTSVFDGTARLDHTNIVQGVMPERPEPLIWVLCSDCIKKVNAFLTKEKDNMSADKVESTDNIIKIN